MGFANYGLVSGECRFKPEPIGTPPRRSSNRTIVALAHRVRRIAVSPVVPSEPPARHSSPTARGLAPPVFIRRLPTEIKRSKPSFSAGI